MSIFYMRDLNVISAETDKDFDTVFFPTYSPQTWESIDSNIDTNIFSKIFILLKNERPIFHK